MPCFPCWPPALPLGEEREGLFLRLSRLTIPFSLENVGVVCVHVSVRKVREASAAWTYQGMLTFERTLLEVRRTGGTVHLEYV